MQRLRAACGREGIYEAIRELVENLVGSSEVAIYERRDVPREAHRGACGEAGAVLQLGAADHPETTLVVPPVDDFQTTRSSLRRGVRCRHTINASTLDVLAAQ